MTRKSCWISNEWKLLLQEKNWNYQFIYKFLNDIKFTKDTSLCRHCISGCKCKI